MGGTHGHSVSFRAIRPDRMLIGQADNGRHKVSSIDADFLMGNSPLGRNNRAVIGRVKLAGKRGYEKNS